MNKISLLVLDDEKYVLSSLRRLFRDSSFNLHTALTPKEAFDILKKNEIGVIICDYKLEQMNGAEFLAKTKEKWPDISRILLTGYFNSHIAENALKKGEVHRFMTKPWNDDDLKMTVETSLKRYELLKQNRELIKVTRSQNNHLTHLTLNLKQVIENRIEKTLKSKNAIRGKKIQLQITYSIIKGLSRAKNLKDVFKIILNELKKLIPFDDASIVVEIQPNQHYLLNQKNIRSKKSELKTHAVQLKKFPVIQKIFKFKNPIISEKGTPLLWGNRKYRSHLFFPLTKENHSPKQCMATLNFASRHAHAFTHEEMKQLEDIANPIAIAIEKMKLLEIVEQGSKQWESTFDAISDLVTVIDKNFNLIKANRATEKITGKKVEKVIGKKCYEVLANRKSPCRNCPAQLTVKKQAVTSENEIIDFEDKDYLSWSFPIFDKNRRIRKIVVYYRDHTQSSQLFRQLIQSEKMAAIGHLAGSLAHELNNPLTGITAFSQILMKELGPKNQFYADMVEIEKASLRCKNIIDNLLNFSEKQHSKKAMVSINDIIESTLPLIQYSSSGKQNVKVFKKLAALPKIKGNINELQQVFLNLMLNAFQAMPKGGTMTVKSTILPKKSSVQITVSDTGVGIPKHALSKIFDPFYTTKEKTRGTGLGLSVSYGIIQDHKGKIEIKSQIKRGSTFKIILPVETKN